MKKKPTTISIYLLNIGDFIIGYCTEYNELGARIQLHYGIKCDDVQPPCAKVYRSTEAYKCMLKIKYKRKHLSLDLHKTPYS